MFDIIIEKGKVYDGSGQEPFVADVGISGGIIIAVGDLEGEESAKKINAEGLVVTPGFIDDHSHGDLNVLGDPQAVNVIGQGITTEITGCCGLSFAPMVGDRLDSMVTSQLSFASDEKKAELFKDTSFPEYLDMLDSLDMATNLVCYMGQGTVRNSVMGYQEGEANEEQLAEMKKIVREGMEAGAAGISTGLIYPTGSLTGTAEITELCKVVAEYGGRYSTHMRNEGDRVIEAVDEALEITRGSGVKLIVSHHKIAGIANHGKSAVTLANIDKAIGEGLDIHMDQYPFIAGATSVTAAVPRKYLADRNAFAERIAFDKVLREEVKAAILKNELEGENMVLSSGGFGGIMVASCEGHPEYSGKTIEELAVERGVDGFDMMFDVITQSKGSAIGVFFTMGEEDLIRIMKHPRTMMGTDASHATYTNVFGHPRAFSTVPELLTKYVRDKGILSLEEFVRKACALPAEVQGLKSKGRIKEGFDADIVVMDLENMEICSSYANPSGGNKGFRYVIVNGEVEVEDDMPTGVLAGKLQRIH